MNVEKLNLIHPEPIQPPLEFKEKSGRMLIAAEKLKEQGERLKDIKIRPRVGILADKDRIENQQIDVIDCEDIGVYQVMFKLTQGWYEKILQKAEELGANVEYISYHPYKPKENREIGSFTLTEAFVIKRGIVSVRISKAYEHNEGEIRSAKGLVQIEIPKTEIKDPKDVESKVIKILQEIFEVSDGLEPPGPEEEKNYKIARYMWHHKLDDLSDKEKSEVADKLQRREVFHGYFTFVDEGRSVEYAAISPFVIFHKLNSAQTLSQIVKAGGLICTHERYRRGLMYNGMSSVADLAKGGGDSVFTRIYTQDGLGYARKVATDDNYLSGGFKGFNIIFSPSLLDRTDWYAYQTDRYGDTRSEFFTERQSPDQVFNKQKQKFNTDNEQMFRLGIGLNDFKAVTVPNIESVLELVAELEKNAITQINGISIAQFIYITKSSDEAIQISMGHETQAKTLQQVIDEEPRTIERIKHPRVFKFLDMSENVLAGIEKTEESDAYAYSANDVFAQYYRGTYAVRDLLKVFKDAPDKYRREALEILKKIDGSLPNFYKKIVGLASKGKLSATESFWSVRTTYLGTKKHLKYLINEFEVLPKAKGNE